MNRSNVRRGAVWLLVGPGAPWLGVVLVLLGTSVPYWPVWYR